MLDKLEGFAGHTDSHKECILPLLSLLQENSNPKTEWQCILSFYDTAPYPPGQKKSYYYFYLCWSQRIIFFSTPSRWNKTKILIKTSFFATGSAVEVCYFFPRHFSSRGKLPWAIPNLIPCSGNFCSNYTSEWVVAIHQNLILISQRCMPAWVG